MQRLEESAQVIRDLWAGETATRYGLVNRAQARFIRNFAKAAFGHAKDS